MLQLTARRALLAVALAASASAAQEGDLGGLGASELGEGVLDGEHGAAGTGSVTLRLGVYDRDDSGDGNPFLDETLTVIEPLVLIDYNATEKFGYSALISYDNVSSASIDRLSEFDAQSGASGDYYAGVDLGFRYLRSEDTSLGGHLHASTEYDYTSVGLGGSLTRQLDDATLKFKLNGFFDSIDVIRFDGEEEGSDDKTSVAGTVTWYQILSPNSHGELGLTLSQQRGFLETAYNAVVVEDPTLPPNENLDNMARGYEITEELPDDRFRAALYGQVRHRLSPGNAVGLGGRIYNDDWGITAFSLEPSYHRMLTDRLRWKVRYRYYVQSEADAYRSSFTTEEDERTQDSDLADFDSHLFGTHLTLLRPGGFWDLGLDYLLREDGLDHVYASVGWKWSF